MSLIVSHWVRPNIIQGRYTLRCQDEFKSGLGFYILDKFAVPMQAEAVWFPETCSLNWNIQWLFLWFRYMMHLIASYQEMSFKCLSHHAIWRVTFWLGTCRMLLYDNLKGNAVHKSWDSIKWLRVVMKPFWALTVILSGKRSFLWSVHSHDIGHNVQLSSVSGTIIRKAPHPHMHLNLIYSDEEAGSSTLISIPLTQMCRLGKD